MPLLDHFQPPLSGERHWESFHAAWAGSIADLLNRDLLPEGYFAEEHVHVGSRVEIDVATFESVHGSPSGGGVAVAPQPWTVPAPVEVWPALFPDSLEVLVYSGESGPTLVAAVELVSPGNKDRPEARRAFVAKCASYLQQGIGLVVIDIVTSRSADFHAEIAVACGQSSASRAQSALYAVAYRPRRTDAGDAIEVWPAQLAIGKSLPTLPLSLGIGLTVPLDLDQTYQKACDRRRINQYPRSAS